MNDNKVKVTVDGMDVLVEPGSSVLQACEKVGVEIPRFCFHERLLVSGNCRMCLVEIEKQIKPVASCAMPVMPNMNIFTDTPLVKKAREGVLEFLLLNHPLDCPICDQGGECDLQDQAMLYGSDRSRFYETKRGVEDNNYGPLVKSIMTRCIHCTRCVRFATEVAGVPTLGTTGRGVDTEVGTYIEQTFKSELSGNIIDLCPVGALTSKPYAFTARPWELQHTESVDVHDALGSNIRIDSRGTEIMRIIPRLHEDLNEEWISDKARFSYDGLKSQRLMEPMVRKEGQLQPVSWMEALNAIKKAHQTANEGTPSAVVGELADMESSFMLKRLLAALGSSDITTTFQGVDASPVLGKDFLGSETFGSTVRAIEEADVILMVGTFPRKECPLIEARLRKRFLEGNVRMATVYHNDSDYQQKHTYDVEHLGSDLSVVQSIAEGVHPFCQALAQSKNPLILYGAKILQDEDASAIVAMLRDIEALTKAFSGTSQDVLNCIQPSASQMGSSWLGFQGSKKQTSSDETSILFGLHVSGEALLEVVEARQPSFVVVQGSHGDAALTVADVVLPGAAYTEKDSLFVNTEGRIQGTRRALTPPGESRVDWSILAALSEVLGVSQGMHSLEEVRDALQGSLLGSNSSWGEAPGSRGSSRLPEPEWLPRFALGQASGSKKMTSWVNDYYRTDVISKNSAVMAKCSQILNEPNVGVQNG